MSISWPRCLNACLYMDISIIAAPFLSKFCLWSKCAGCCAYRLQSPWKSFLWKVHLGCADWEAGKVKQYFVLNGFMKLDSYGSTNHHNAPAIGVIHNSVFHQVGTSLRPFLIFRVDMSPISSCLSRSTSLDIAGCSPLKAFGSLADEAVVNNAPKNSNCFKNWHIYET